jgi:glucose-6-phosphate 1-dehydrogenase
MKKQFILYGATGNLAKLYLIGSLYQLWKRGEAVKIIAISLENWSNEEFCQNILAGMKEKGSAPEGIDQDWHLFSQNIVYIRLDLQEANYDLPEVA